MVKSGSEAKNVDWTVAHSDDGRWWIAPLGQLVDGALALDSEAESLLRAAASTGHGQAFVVFADGRREALGQQVPQDGRLALPPLKGLGAAGRRSGRIELLLGR